MTVLEGCLDVAQGGCGLSLKAEANPEVTLSGRLSAHWAPHVRLILCGDLSGATLWLPQDNNQ